MNLAPHLDLALAFNSATRRCDIAFRRDGDARLDRSAATALLVSLGSDRRARPDDGLPSGFTFLNSTASFVARRGWAGDALDRRGRLLGSRLWLLDREKQTEGVRRFAESYATEALAWLESDRRIRTDVTVTWARPQWLLINARAGNTELPLWRRAA